MSVYKEYLCNQIFALLHYQQPKVPPRFTTILSPIIMDIFYLIQNFKNAITSHGRQLRNVFY